MLPKKYRLNVKEFDHVIKNGKNYTHGTLHLKFVRNNLEISRFGVAVSKKITKTAVKRNYYKRLLRHLLKEVFPSVKAGYDIILIAGPGVKDKSFDELKNTTEQLFKKSGIME